MPSHIVAHYIKSGLYDWNLRISTQKPKSGYKQYYLPKKDWTLDEVKLYRNKLCLQFEKDGLRDSGTSKRGGRIQACNLGMN